MLRKISQNCYFIWIKNQKVAPIWYFSSEIPNLCFGFLVRSFGIFPSNLVFSQPIWYFSSQSGIFSPNLVFFQKIWYSIKWNGVHTPHLDIAVRNFEQAPLAPVEPAASVSGIKISQLTTTLLLIPPPPPPPRDASFTCFRRMRCCWGIRNIYKDCHRDWIHSISASEQ